MNSLHLVDPELAPILQQLPSFALTDETLALVRMEYARRLMRAGVPTELHVDPGAFHGYLLAPQARVTQNADRDAEQALRRALQRA